VDINGGGIGEDPSTTETDLKYPDGWTVLSLHLPLPSLVF
jgi:hypothetical protein